MFYRIAIILAILWLPLAAEASTAADSCRRTVHRLRADVAGGYAFSSIAVETDPAPPGAGAPVSHTAWSASLGWDLEMTDPAVRNYYPGVRQGLIVGVLSFDRPGYGLPSRLIGTPVTLCAMQQVPLCRLSPRLTLGYAWRFGASVGWKPWDDGANHDFNIKVGSRVNAVIDLGALLSYRLSDRWALTAALALTHYSNGNTAWPNPGVNTLSLRLGAEYTLNPMAAPAPAPLTDTLRSRRPQTDITLWWAARRRVYKGGDTPRLRPGHFSCLGITVAPMWRLRSWRWLRLGPGVELQWDESSDMERNKVPGLPDDHPQFYRPAFGRQLSAGLSAHAEIAMPIFSVNLGAGVNLLAPHENRGTYQSLTLKTYFTRWLYLNIGYQLRNFTTQSNLMLGTGLTL